ncbi:GNAT family N-acetyltransferase [Paludifilum halophilum]|uniref:GNAT family N-acetyltransferase n=1 Tax=Paludifilum halophilum TaxID=1642702 RepID=A0A235BBL8_9BACL|nr:GNAT family N-acetyltransferase [Paludifilum halophilum]OYD09683.1 GNAT family N-acetyltransferase [Paludifilum halophilum]
MSLYIREANNGDAEILAKLMGELTHEPISVQAAEDRLNFVRNSPFDFLYVCAEKQDVLGFMSFRIRENIESPSRYGEISAIVVHPEVQNQGVGRFLVEYAEKLAKKHGCMGTWLVSGFGSEEKAHSFYKKLGYDITGYRFRKLQRPEQG